MPHMHLYSQQESTEYETHKKVDKYVDKLAGSAIRAGVGLSKDSDSPLQVVTPGRHATHIVPSLRGKVEAILRLYLAPHCSSTFSLDLLRKVGKYKQVHPSLRSIICAPRVSASRPVHVIQSQVHACCSCDVRYTAACTHTRATLVW